MILASGISEMKSFKRSDLTDDECEQLIQTLAEWLRNLTYMKAEDWVRPVLDDILKGPNKIAFDDTITFKLQWKTSGNDLLMMIGGIRRKAKYQ